MPAGRPAREITLDGTLDAVARAAGWAEDLAAAGLLPPRRLYDVQLCLEEALSNIVRYGFAATAVPRIRLRLAQPPGAVLIEIADNGAPFDPTAFVPPPPAASLEEARPGGLGIVLLRRFADALLYERRDGENSLTLRFDRPVTPDGS